MAERKKNTTYARNEESMAQCDLTYTLTKIGGRWKLQILDKLENGKLRFSELKRAFPLITERMLTLQLKSMEQDGLIKRTVFPEVPAKVEYELTDMTLALCALLKPISVWGGMHRNFQNTMNNDHR